MDNSKDKDANRYGDHSGLREKLLEQFQPLQEKLCSALEDSQDLLTQFRRNTSLAGIFDAPMISVQLMKGVDALFGSPSPKVIQRGQNTMQKPISWPDIATARNCKIENKEAGVFRYHLDDLEAIAELSEFQHSIVLSGLLQKLTQPWSYKRDVQTELYTLSSIADTAGLSIQLAARTIEVNDKILEEACNRTCALRFLLRQWDRPTISNPGTSALTLRNPLSIFGSRSTIHPKRRYSFDHAGVAKFPTRHACAEKPSQPHKIWAGIKYRRLTGRLINRRSFLGRSISHFRKGVCALRRRQMSGRVYRKEISFGGVSFPDVLLIPKRPCEQSKSDSGRSRSGVWNSRPDIESFHHRRLNDCSTLTIDDCKQAPPVATSEDVNIQSGPQSSSDAMTPNTRISFTYENREHNADQNDPLNEPPAPLDPGTEKMVYPAYSVAGSSAPEKTMSHPTEDSRLLTDPQRHSSAPIGKVSADRDFFDTQKPETGMTKHSDQDNRAMDRSNDPALTPLKMPIENKDDNISCAGGFCMVKANSPIYTPRSPSIHGVVSPIYTPLSPPKYA